MGAPSLPPGRYFRMHMVGYCYGRDRQRKGHRVALLRFVFAAGFPCGLRTGTRFLTTPGLSKTRSRLPHEVHEKVFGWVLALVAELRSW